MEAKKVLVPTIEVDKVPPSKALLVFSCCMNVPPPNSLPVVPLSLTATPHLQPSSAPSDISIVLRKSKRSSITHSISRFVSYDKLTLYFATCPFLSTVSIPKPFQKDMSIPTWQKPQMRRCKPSSPIKLEIW